MGYINAISLYRVGNYCYVKGIPFVPNVCKALNFIIFNSVIPCSCTIGKDSKFAYGGIGVVLHSRSSIGDRVIIGQGVTIGRKLSPEGVPRIGSDVYISAGARVLGGVTVGNNVIIGANSVVISDIPDNCIYAGVPARVVKKLDVSIYDLLENVL